MICYELYRVTFRYNDVGAEERWAKETEDMPDDDMPPPPDPRTEDRYVTIRTGAVDWGEGPGRAAKLALLMGVGPPDTWERYEPAVLLVELVDECIHVDGVD